MPIGALIPAISALLPTLIHLAEGIFKKKDSSGNSTGPSKKSFVVSSIIGILHASGIVKSGSEAEPYVEALGAAVDAFVSELKAAGKL